MGILVISIIFLMIPSTLVGIGDLFSLAAFLRLGPFYMVGLLLAGISNSFTYLTLHGELRLAAKETLCCTHIHGDQVASSGSAARDAVLSVI